MNNKNVAALQEIVREASERQIIRATFLDYRQFAAWLSARGVLVPSALEDQQIREVLEVGKVCVQQDDPLFREDAARDVLERIAKGETQGGTE